MLHRRLSLKQFRYFLAVSELGSVASAARMVNIAQSAVTKSILEIEGTLGVQLFERSAKGMVLTQAGYRFQAHARKVISAVAEATNVDLDMEPAQELTGSLTIGVTSLVAGYYLADLFARFKRSHPSVKLSLIEETPQFLEHLLINGEVDLSIMVANEVAEPQALVVEVLTSSPNRVWLSPSHPLAKQAELTLAECASVPQIVLQTDRIEAIMSTVWSRHQLRPTVLMRSGSLEAVRSLVGEGVGLAVLPDFLYRPWTLDAERVEARHLREAVPSVNIGLVWRRSSLIRNEVLQFIEMAQEQRDRKRK